jgi:hypothetical protein
MLEEDRAGRAERPVRLAAAMLVAVADAAGCGRDAVDAAGHEALVSFLNTRVDQGAALLRRVVHRPERDGLEALGLDLGDAVIDPAVPGRGC